MESNEPLETLTLELPKRTLDVIRAKVSAGSFLDASAVVEESIARMDDFEGDLDHWIRTEGEAIADRMRAEPSRNLTPEELLAKLGIREHEETEAA